MSYPWLYRLIRRDRRPSRSSHPQRRVSARRVRPQLEVLEDRVLLDAVRWINASGGDWSTASNWDLQRIPGPADDAIIEMPGITVTHLDSGRTDSIHSLTISNGTFNILGGTLSVATMVQG